MERAYGSPHSARGSAGPHGETEHAEEKGLQLPMTAIPWRIPPSLDKAQAPVSTWSSCGHLGSETAGGAAFQIHVL